MPSETITLTDGTKLNAIVEGSGPPLIMVPGWSQSANGFKHQIASLSDVRTVIALDMRGHGDSDKPKTGYRIQRLAKDLFDVICAKGLEQPDVLGHSMGCSIIWSYNSMFGAEKPLGRLVLVDQAPAVVAQPGWDEDTKSNAGCLLPDMEALAGFMDGVIASTTADATKEIIRGMFTEDVDEADLDWIAAENIKLPRDRAAHLLHDHCVLDWRTEIEAIGNPTLVIGGEASIFSAASQRWISEHIPDAQVEVFGADEGGSHFMFWQNSQKFNAIVKAFLDA